MPRRRKKIYEAPRIPVKRGQFRDPAHVKTLVVRMGDAYIDELDRLCEINNRSRREFIEILVARAAYDLAKDPKSRVNPL